MDMSFDVKCSVTTAILSVLVYLLLINLFERVWTDGKVGIEINKLESHEIYKSMEIIMLLAVLIGYNINSHLFNSCRSA